MDDRAKVKLIASQLAKLHGPAPTSACACIGISCEDPSCPIWWEMALENKKDLARAVILFHRVKNLID